MSQLQVPSLIQSVKEHGLLLTTFGSESPETLSFGADAHMRNGVLQYASQKFMDAVES